MQFTARNSYRKLLISDSRFIWPQHMRQKYVACSFATAKQIKDCGFPSQCTKPFRKSWAKMKVSRFPQFFNNNVKQKQRYQRNALVWSDMRCDQLTSCHAWGRNLPCANSAQRYPCSTMSSINTGWTGNRKHRLPQIFPRESMRGLQLLPHICICWIQALYELTQGSNQLKASFMACEHLSECTRELREGRPSWDPAPF